MARKLRVEYGGALRLKLRRTGVLNRRDRREAIFRDDEDRQCFVRTLEEAKVLGGGGTGTAREGRRGEGGEAVRLRAESAVTVKWIAARLQMGTMGYANHLLYRQRKNRKGKYAKIKNRPVYSRAWLD